MASDIILYVCDPEKHRDCGNAMLCARGEHNYCYATARRECAKLDENGQPMLLTDKFLDSIKAEYK